MTAELDLDQIESRTTGAHAWLLRDQREQEGSDWLPLTIREHFTRDVPAMLAELRRLRGPYEPAVDGDGDEVWLDEDSQPVALCGCENCKGLDEPKPSWRRLYVRTETAGDAT